MTSTHTRSSLREGDGRPSRAHSRDSFNFPTDADDDDSAIYSELMVPFLSKGAEPRRFFSEDFFCSSSLIQLGLVASAQHVLTV